MKSPLWCIRVREPHAVAECKSFAQITNCQCFTMFCLALVGAPATVDPICKFIYYATASVIIFSALWIKFHLRIRMYVEFPTNRQENKFALPCTPHSVRPLTVTSVSTLGLPSIVNSTPSNPTARRLHYVLNKSTPMNDVFPLFFSYFHVCVCHYE